MQIRREALWKKCVAQPNENRLHMAVYMQILFLHMYANIWQLLDDVIVVVAAVVAGCWPAAGSPQLFVYLQLQIRCEEGQNEKKKNTSSLEFF